MTNKKTEQEQRLENELRITTRKNEILASRIGSVEMSLADKTAETEIVSAHNRQMQEKHQQLIKENEQLQKRVKTLEFAEESEKEESAE